MIENAKSIIVYKQALGYSDNENNFGLISEITHPERNKKSFFDNYNALRLYRDTKIYLSEKRFIFSIEQKGILFMGLSTKVNSLLEYKSTFNNDNYFISFEHIHNIDNSQKVKLVDGNAINGTSFNITNEYGYTQKYVQLTYEKGVMWPSVNAEPIKELIENIQYSELIEDANNNHNSLTFDKVKFKPSNKRVTKKHEYDRNDNIYPDSSQVVHTTVEPIIDDQYVHNLFSGHNYKIYQNMWVNYDVKKVYLRKTFLQKARVIDFKDLLSYMPIERNSHVSKHHRVTRGVVGGLLAGGIGAGIGAATGGKEFDKTDELSLVLNLSNGDHYKISFGKDLKSDGWMSKTLTKRFNECVSVLDFILTKNTETLSQPRDDNFEPKLTDSKVEELTHLKRLLDLDVITQAEFNKRKDEIF